MREAQPPQFLIFNSVSFASSSGLLHVQSFKFDQQLCPARLFGVAVLCEPQSPHSTQFFFFAQSANQPVPYFQLKDTKRQAVGPVP